MILIWCILDISRTWYPNKRRFFLTLSNTSIIPKSLLKSVENLHMHKLEMPLMKWITTATFSWIKLLLANQSLYSCISKVFVPFILFHFAIYYSQNINIDHHSIFCIVPRHCHVPTMIQDLVICLALQSYIQTYQDPSPCTHTHKLPALYLIQWPNKRISQKSMAIVICKRTY